MAMYVIQCDEMAAGLLSVELKWHTNEQVQWLGDYVKLNDLDLLCFHRAS